LFFIAEVLLSQEFCYSRDFLGAKSTSIRDCVGWTVRPSVCRSVPHDARLRGKLVTSRLLREEEEEEETDYVAIPLCRDSIMSRFHYVAIPLHLGIRRSPCYYKINKKVVSNQVLCCNNIVFEGVVIPRFKYWKNKVFTRESSLFQKYSRHLQIRIWSWQTSISLNN
jgi:hypothetical protein